MLLGISTDDRVVEQLTMVPEEQSRQHGAVGSIFTSNSIFCLRASWPSRQELSLLLWFTAQSVFQVIPAQMLVLELLLNADLQDTVGGSQQYF